MYQISSESPKFYRRYYKNILVSFSGHDILTFRLYSFTEYTKITNHYRSICCNNCSNHSIGLLAHPARCVM